MMHSLPWPQDWPFMTKQLLISVGKRHDPALSGAIEEFTQRLAREVETGWLLIKPSGADEPTARRLESTSVLAALKPDDYVVLLDERGEQFDSPGFASTYLSWLERPGRVVFIIGGAYGVDERLYARANTVWALSKLVFPHQVVRVILAEQLYRAHMIVKNHPYHHT